MIENNVTLLYVQKGYRYAEILDKIKTVSRRFT